MTLLKNQPKNIEIQQSGENNEYKDIIIFDVWGDFAHFKKNYATTSSISHYFPPRHTIAGLIGAILGIKRARFPEELSPNICDIGISILSEIRQKTMTINLILTGAGLINQNIMGLFKEHTQIPFQFIVEPRYRIYFSSSNSEIHEQLYNNLIEHKSYYTPTLGLSNLICDFKLIKRIKAFRYTRDEFVKVISAVPRANIKQIDLFRSKSFHIENAARWMNAERIAKEYQEIIISRNVEKDQYLYIKPAKELWKIENDCYISFL